MAKIKITAYDMKAKQKGVEMLNAVIDKTERGQYFCKGESAAGNKMCVAMGKEKAEEAIKEGVAKKGKGW